MFILKKNNVENNFNLSFYFELKKKNIFKFIYILELKI